MQDPKADLEALEQRFAEFRTRLRAANEASEWQRASDALATLIELPGAERAAALDAIAAGDAALRAELATLLRGHEATSALDAPVLDVVLVAPESALPELPAWSGEVIGARYHVLADAVGGGMGVVVKALDDRLDRIVALKFLSVAFARERRRARALPRGGARDRESRSPERVCDLRHGRRVGRSLFHLDAVLSRRDDRDKARARSAADRRRVSYGFRLRVDWRPRTRAESSTATLSRRI